MWTVKNPTLPRLVESGLFPPMLFTMLPCNPAAFPDRGWQNYISIKHSMTEERRRRKMEGRLQPTRKARHVMLNIPWSLYRAASVSS